MDPAGYLTSFQDHDRLAVAIALPTLAVLVDRIKDNTMVMGGAV